MTVRDIVATSLFAAMIAILGFIPAIPVLGSPVPITAQGWGVMMAGLILGGKRGFYSVAIIWILAAIGMPVLAGGRGGLQSFVAPTSGYLLGWGLGVWVIGVLAGLHRNHLMSEIVALFIGGIFVVHVCGVIWLCFFAKLTFMQAALVDLIFIPGDIIKLILTLIITRQLRRAMPGAFERP